MVISFPPVLSPAKERSSRPYTMQERIPQDASPELLKLSQEYCLANGLQNNFHVAGWSDLIANCYREYPSAFAGSLPAA